MYFHVHARIGVYVLQILVLSEMLPQASTSTLIILNSPHPYHFFHCKYMYLCYLKCSHKQVQVHLINPRHACAARVTVVVLSFCLSVCLSVTTFSAATRNKTVNERYKRVQCHTGFIFKIAFFCKNAAFESYGVKQSEGANMQISTGLPRSALRTLETSELATQGEYRLLRAI